MCAFARATVCVRVCIHAKIPVLSPSLHASTFVVYCSGKRGKKAAAAAAAAKSAPKNTRKAKKTKSQLLAEVTDSSLQHLVVKVDPSGYESSCSCAVCLCS